MSGGGGGFAARFSTSTNSSGSVASMVPATMGPTGSLVQLSQATTSNPAVCSTLTANPAGSVSTVTGKAVAAGFLPSHQHYTPAIVMFTNASVGAAAIHSSTGGGGTPADGASGGRVSAHASPVRSQSHYYHLPHPSHPLHHPHRSGMAAGGIPHFSVDSATYQQIIDRRKSFRTRGSLGPTVASAPSVEQEDYRTPKPPVEPVKNGKSFDFGGALNAGASDSNGLIKVSADFLRLNGSRQQFRSLLSRKKLGQMPSAYTRIDYSHDSIESNNTSSRVHHPLITVEDAAVCQPTSGSGGPASAGRVGTPTAAAVGHGLGSRHNSGSGGGAGGQAFHHQLHQYHNHNRRPSVSSTAGGVGGGPTTLVDLQKCSFDKLSEKQLLGQALLPTSGQYLTAPSPGGSPGNNVSLKRGNSRYGGPIDESAIKMVYKIRSMRLNTRVHITNRCLLMAMIGILLMVVDTEICGQKLFGITKDHVVSLLLRVFVVVSTVALLISIIQYHVNEILLELVDCGADDFRVVLTWRRTLNFAAEFLLCSICPLPFTGTIRWSFIEPARYRSSADMATLGDPPATKDVPVDVLLSMMMLSRVYLIGRFMVLHSKQFQDASTRTLAALNRIQVNFAFVMKTVLDQRPVVFLSLFLLIFWMTTAWTFAQCERWGRDEEPSILYTNALWFIAITFNGNGYGDIVPKTIAGKAIAVLVGIFGAVMSSILIAVISRKILLSQGQKNVNNFMNDSRLIQEHKNAAARVLQKTWHIYKCLKAPTTPGHLLRHHQRRFLDAIHKFRRIKNKIRVFNEDSSTSFQQMNRLMTEMHTSMQRLVSAQDEMRAQIEVLQRAMRNHFTNANANHNGHGNGGGFSANHDYNHHHHMQNSVYDSESGGPLVITGSAHNHHDGYGIARPAVSGGHYGGHQSPQVSQLNTPPRVAFDANVQTHFIARASQEQSLDSSKRSMSAASGASVDQPPVQSSATAQNQPAVGNGDTTPIV